MSHHTPFQALRTQLDTVNELVREEMKKPEEEVDRELIARSTAHAEELTEKLLQLPQAEPIHNEWDATQFASRVQDEVKNLGGFECLFPTKGSVADNRKYFINETQTRNEALWNKLAL